MLPQHPITTNFGLDQFQGVGGWLEIPDIFPLSLGKRMSGEQMLSGAFQALFGKRQLVNLEGTDQLV